MLTTIYKTKLVTKIIVLCATNAREKQIKTWRETDRDRDKEVVTEEQKPIWIKKEEDKYAK